jgi:hypothetical protein
MWSEKTAHTRMRYWFPKLGSIPGAFTDLTLAEKCVRLWSERWLVMEECPRCGEVVDSLVFTPVGRYYALHMCESCSRKEYV